MKVLGRMAIFPAIPSRINRLYELAFNIWWSWNLEAQSLYRIIDSKLWDRLEHNPVKFLSEVDPHKLEAVATDSAYVERYNHVIAAFDSYMHPKDTWFSRTYADLAGQTIAYFSAEFGMHEALPIYSGGLGILSGDHCKEASDLGLPFVGVGFLYPQGYFRQRISREGVQEAISEKMHFSEVPAIPATTPKGEEVLISVDLPGRKVYAKVWKIQVGRIPLYLMDTDVEPNAPSDRDLSARLYGGDHEIRISQEIVLGIGGVRALRALGFQPAVWHMNEGHSAFLGLERICELVAKEAASRLSFSQAREIVAANSIFTTHTPVPAGNDAFSFDLIDKYFHNYWPQLGLDRDQFLNIARQGYDWNAAFSMTVLALRLSDAHNGVSELHGSVSRKLWQFLWPGVDANEVPITYVTNGIHSKTWLAEELDALYKKYLGQDWADHVDEPALWAQIQAIPDAELWNVHTRLRHTLISFVRERIRLHRLRLGEGSGPVDAAAGILDPNALTIGFARRFATYKRATLIFRDLPRLKRLLNKAGCPVQFIFAGKAHPADEPGKSFIQQVYQFSRQEGIEGKVVFLEDYDMNMARFLVHGVDMWLNNPIRPLEASGTSGQKAALNGVPNCSILDGWWVEGYNGRNGWAIGEEREYENPDTQAEADSLALYATLEELVVPTFFDRDEDGIPHQWVAVMKEAIRTCAPQFSMRRMVKDYTTQLYVPAAKHGEKMAANDYSAARILAKWKQGISQNWEQVQIWAQGPREGQLSFGETIDVRAVVKLGSLQPSDVSVELVYGHDENGKIIDQNVQVMEHTGLDTWSGPDVHNYIGKLVMRQGGSLVYGVRVLPSNDTLLNKHEIGLIRWA